MPTIEFKVIQKPIEERLIDAACIYWDVERNYFTKKHESAECSKTVYRKGVLYYLIKNATPYSYRSIAESFGFLSHQPVMRSIDLITFQKMYTESINQDIKHIETIAAGLNVSVVVSQIELK